jgi:hypothetical protein
MDTAVTWRVLVQAYVIFCVCGAPQSNPCIITNMKLSFEIIIHYNHCNNYQSNFPIWSSYRHDVQMKVPTSINRDTKYFMLLYFMSLRTPRIIHHPSLTTHFLTTGQRVHRLLIPRTSTLITDDSTILHRHSSAVPIPWHYLRKRGVCGTEEHQTVDTSNTKRLIPIETGRV